MSTLMNVTDKSFEQDVLQSSKPFLLDFWAEIGLLNLVKLEFFAL